MSAMKVPTGVLNPGGPQISFCPSPASEYEHSPKLSFTQTLWHLLAERWSRTRMAMTSTLDRLRKRRWPWQEKSQSWWQEVQIGGQSASRYSKELETDGLS